MSARVTVTDDALGYAMSAQPIEVMPAAVGPLKIKWTRFFDAGTSRKLDVEQTWADLIRHVEVAGPFPEKSKCWWIKLARFGDATTEKGALRYDANLIEITGIEGDYDGGAVPPEAAIAMLERAGIRACVYPSPSSRPDAPRWRVLAPLSYPYPPEARAALLARVNGALGGILAAESFTLSQSYYYGRVTGAPNWRVLVTFNDPDDGACVDTLDELDSIAIGRPTASTPKAGTPSVGAGEPVRFTDAEALVAQLRRKLRSGDGRRALLMRYVTSRSARGFAAAEITALVRAFTDTYFDPESPHDDYRVENLIEWAAARDEKTRKELEQIELGALVRVTDGGDVPAVPWPDPQSIATRIESTPYPLDALPTVLRDAIEEVQGFVQAPVALVATSALAAASVAVQAYVDVRRAEGLSGPVGLFLLAIAESGERKSTCDRFFSKPIAAYEKAQAEAAEGPLKDFKSAMAAWEADREGVLAAIKQDSKAGKPTEKWKLRLDELQYAKPEPPRVPRLIYNDATPEALTYALAKVWPAAGVLSSEAGSVLGAHGMGRESVMRNLATYNQLWDGADLSFDRRTSESFAVRGARLTVALQVQPTTLRDFLERVGELARGTGFLARFLVAWPTSTQGTRMYVDPPQAWPALEALHARFRAILETPAPVSERGALEPQMLTLSPDAKKVWTGFYNDVERELGLGGALYDVQDVAAKAADNVARLAAVFHVVAGRTGAIAGEDVATAGRIVAWHLNECRRFFGELVLSADQMNAARLDEWLVNQCRSQQTRTIATKDALQRGPASVRKAAKLDAAVVELAELGRVRMLEIGPRRLIEVNPALVGG
jgi:hypothetical protein